MSLPIVELDQPLPLPIQVSRVTAPFWQGLAQGRFQATRCGDCDYLAFPPKVCCPGCGGEEMGWQALSGRGHLYAYTTIHAAPPLFSDLPLRVAIVDLEEGIRLVTSLVDCNDVALDTPVVLQVRKFNNGYLFAASPR